MKQFLVGCCCLASLTCKSLGPGDHQTADAADQERLLIGDYALGPSPVIDGDTLEVVGLEKHLRLLAIDTEETFKNDDDRLSALTDWPAYVASKRGDARKPVKMSTPLGDRAKAFAETFFTGITTVRLERDHSQETHGRYNRILTYVFVSRDGQWVNYNLECVRAGMSPYYTKYGYSRRFHEQFVQAQAEAQRAHRGIWDPRLKHYPDYPERLAWWASRAEMIRTFEQEAAGKRHFVVLTHQNALARVHQLVGHNVVLLGAVGSIYTSDKGLTRVYLSRKRGEDFPLIFYSPEVLKGSRIADYEMEFVRVSGEVTIYHNDRTDKDQIQIVVEHPGQVETRGAWSPIANPQAAPPP